MNLFNHICHPRTPKINAVHGRTAVEPFAAEAQRFDRHFRRQSDFLRASQGQHVVERFGFDGMASKNLEFISQSSDGLVLFFQGFGLQDGLPLGLGQIITALVRDLVHGAGRTWLNAITLTRPPSEARRRTGFRSNTHLDLPLPTRVTGQLRTLGFLAHGGRADEQLMLVGMVGVGMVVGVGVGKGIDGVHVSSTAGSGRGVMNWFEGRIP